MSVFAGLIILCLGGCGNPLGKSSQSPSPRQTEEPAQLGQLEKEGQELLKKFSAAGMLDKSWSPQKLSAYRQLLNDMKNNVDQKMKILENHPDKKAELTKLRGHIEGLIQKVPGSL